jgi:hypothetical protein
MMSSSLMGAWPGCHPAPEHDFDNREAAKASADSNELKAAMKGAGVIGAPMSGLRATPDFTNSDGERL